MTIESGTRFGNYEIGKSIGAGGMGEVYRATDTTLERDVAIKVLPASFADDAERVTRFEREAKTLAALNHPNIAQIFGLEELDDTTALVMELVEGPTLEDRIAEGPIPADEALGIATQIADALEAAHGQNIVHRDLKPANVKVRADGTVKVLDFGIAKALAPENLVSGPQSPIMTTPATQVGVILGTAAYMSPEQAKGKAVDQRTDIWAFGCVLFEMLSGQLAFGAEDVPTTLARVIDRDADMSSLPASVSPAVSRAIEMCLEKDVRDRLADIRDVRLILKGALIDASSRGGDVAVSPPRRFLLYAATAAASAVIVVLILWNQLGERVLEPDRQVTRFEHHLEPGQEFRGLQVRVLTISPDGRSVAYNTTDGLYLRSLDALEARLIPGTEGNLGVPTFSPDGAWIVFNDREGQELKRVAVTGGAPVAIAALEDAGAEYSWESNDVLLFSNLDGVVRLDTSSRTRELLIPARNNEQFYGPRLLPDGDSILVAAGRQGTGGWDDANIFVYSLAGGERSLVQPGGSDARYLPTGHLVYALGDSLLAVAFDLGTLTVQGGAVPVVQGVMRASAGQTGVANFDVSETGTLAYVTGSVSTAQRELVWVDRSGEESTVGAPVRGYAIPRLSPDGTKIALDVRGRDNDIWIWDLARETFLQITSDPAEDEFPLWTRDGEHIFFARGNRAIFRQVSDGASEPQLLRQRTAQAFPAAITPMETELIIYGANSGSEQDDIEVFDLETRDEPTDLLATESVERNPALSPDGQWLAYSSTESGQEQVFVRPYPEVLANRYQISTDGGGQPVWGRDGRELFYRGGDSVMAVSIGTDPDFSPGRPRALFNDSYVVGPGGRSYDYDPTNDRFLMMEEIEDTSVRPRVVIVENWFEDVERLVPTP